MSASDQIQPPLESEDPVDPSEDPVDPGDFQEAEDPRPIERPLSGARARMWGRSSLHIALTAAVPAWRLTVVASVVVVAFVFFGPLPVALVVAILLLGELIFRIVRRARVKASLRETSSLPDLPPDIQSSSPPRAEGRTRSTARWLRDAERSIEPH